MEHSLLCPFISHLIVKHIHRLCVCTCIKQQQQPKTRTQQQHRLAFMTAGKDGEEKSGREICDTLMNQFSSGFKIEVQ